MYVRDRSIDVVGGDSAAPTVADVLDIEVDVRADAHSLGHRFPQRGGMKRRGSMSKIAGWVRKATHTVGKCTNLVIMLRL